MVELDPQRGPMANLARIGFQNGGGDVNAGALYEGLLQVAFAHGVVG
jgi:hypothetical protein